ncbi:hypothetical protein AB0F17_02020 [Nonomuraea sp. NPDC026600]|uniref:hypothetical protein n=1 Tax=Nonomuraea sp. NPDC026600 TaxID=3155363 RepID=UPI0034106BF1
MDITPQAVVIPKEGKYGPVYPRTSGSPSSRRYPYVTADEIKKALRIKSALSEMLDQLQ